MRQKLAYTNVTTQLDPLDITKLDQIRATHDRSRASMLRIMVREYTPPEPAVEEVEKLT